MFLGTRAHPEVFLGKKSLKKLPFLGSCKPLSGHYILFTKNIRMTSDKNKTAEYICMVELILFNYKWPDTLMNRNEMSAHTLDTVMKSYQYLSCMGYSFVIR
jgi:hypothetical protein